MRYFHLNPADIDEGDAYFEADRADAIINELNYVEETRFYDLSAAKDRDIFIIGEAEEALPFLLSLAKIDKEGLLDAEYIPLCKEGNEENYPLEEFGRLLRVSKKDEAIVFFPSPQTEEAKEARDMILGNLPRIRKTANVYIYVVEEQPNYSSDVQIVNKVGIKYHIFRRSAVQFTVSALIKDCFERGYNGETFHICGANEDVVDVMKGVASSMKGFDKPMDLFVDEDVFFTFNINRYFEALKHNEYMSSLIRFRIGDCDDMREDHVVVYLADENNRLWDFLNEMRYVDEVRRFYILLPRPTSYAYMEESLSKELGFPVTVIGLQSPFADSLFLSPKDSMMEKAAYYLGTWDKTIQDIAIPMGGHESPIPHIGFSDDFHYLAPSRSPLLYKKVLDSSPIEDISSALFAKAGSPLVHAALSNKSHVDGNLVYREIRECYTKDCLMKRFASFEHDCWALRNFFYNFENWEKKSDLLVPFDQLVKSFAPKDINGYDKIGEKDIVFSDFCMGLAFLFDYGLLDDIKKTNYQEAFDKARESKEINVREVVEEYSLSQNEFSTFVYEANRRGLHLFFDKKEEIHIPSSLWRNKMEVNPFTQTFLILGEKDESIKGIGINDILRIEGEDGMGFLVLEASSFHSPNELLNALNTEYMDDGEGFKGKTFRFQWANVSYRLGLRLCRVLPFIDKELNKLENLQKVRAALYSYDISRKTDFPYLRMEAWNILGLDKAFLSLSVKEQLELLDPRGEAVAILDMLSLNQEIGEKGLDVTKELIDEVATLLDSGERSSNLEESSFLGSCLSEEEPRYIKLKKEYPNIILSPLFAGILLTDERNLVNLLDGASSFDEKTFIENGRFIHSDQGTNGIEAFKQAFASFDKDKEGLLSLTAVYPFSNIASRFIAHKFKEAGLLKEENLGVSKLPISADVFNSFKNGTALDSTVLSSYFSALLHCLLCLEDEDLGKIIEDNQIFELICKIESAYLQIEEAAPYRLNDFPSCMGAYYYRFTDILLPLTGFEKSLFFASLRGEFEAFRLGSIEEHNALNALGDFAFAMAPQQWNQIAMAAKKVCVREVPINARRIEPSYRNPDYPVFYKACSALGEIDQSDLINSFTLTHRDNEKFFYEFGKKKVRFLEVGKIYGFGRTYTIATPSEDSEDYLVGDLYIFYKDVRHKDDYFLEESPARINQLLENIQLREDDDD